MPTIAHPAPYHLGIEYSKCSILFSYAVSELHVDLVVIELSRSRSLLGLQSECVIDDAYNTFGQIPLPGQRNGCIPYHLNLWTFPLLERSHLPLTRGKGSHKQSFSLAASLPVQVCGCDLVREALWRQTSLVCHSIAWSRVVQVQSSVRAVRVTSRPLVGG